VTAVTATPREQATTTYTQMWASLMRDARKAERTQRPTLAMDLRRQAAWVHRAALAEEQDPIPHGFASFEPLDHDSREGR
jgi:hypothetical protein